MSSQYACSRPSNYRQSGRRAIAGVKLEVSATPEQFSAWLLLRPGARYWTSRVAIDQFLREVSGAEGGSASCPIWCDLIRVRLGKRAVTSLELMAIASELRPIETVGELVDVFASEDPDDVIDRSKPAPLDGRWFTKEEIEAALTNPHGSLD